MNQRVFPPLSERLYSGKFEESFQETGGVHCTLFCVTIRRVVRRVAMLIFQGEGNLGRVISALEMGDGE